MRVVILTARDIPHRYLARTLSAELPGSIVAVIAPRPRPLSKRLRLLRQRGFVRAMPWLLHRVYWKYSGRGDRHHATFRRLLGDPLPAEGVPERMVESHTSVDCVETIRELGVDLIVVYGAEMLPSAVFSAAAHGAVNVHVGMVPRYRGRNALFWALHERDLSAVGVSVHRIDQQIDTGQVIAVAPVEIRADDDEDSLCCRALQLGVQLVADAIRTLERTESLPVGKSPLSGPGREYRWYERTVAAERRVAKLLRDGLLAEGRTAS